MDRRKQAGKEVGGGGAGEGGGGEGKELEEIPEFLGRIA